MSVGFYLTIVAIDSIFLFSSNAAKLSLVRGKGCQGGFLISSRQGVFLFSF